MTGSDRTTAVLDDLFARPPATADEIVSRLAAADPDRARELLARRLDAGLPSERDAGLLADAFACLGPGTLEVRLRGLAVDPERPLRDRVAAFLALSSGAGAEPVERLAHVGPGPAAELARVSLCALFLVSSRSTVGRNLAAILQALPGGQPRRDFFDRIERCRREMGVTAAWAYGHALAQEPLADLRPALLEAVTRDGGASAIVLLERLRDEARDEAYRRGFQRALLKLRTCALSPRAGPDGSAQVSSCGFDGSLLVAATFALPSGCATLAVVRLQAGGPVLEARVLPRLTPDEASRALGALTHAAPGPLVAAPLDEAALLVRAAAPPRHAEAPDAPAGTPDALDLFAGVPAPRGRPMVPPWIGPAPTAGQARVLLQRPEFARAFAPPRNAGEAHFVAGGQTAQRLPAVLDVMAMWSLWRGDPRAAALCAALGRATREDYATSPLVTAALELSRRPVLC